MSTDAPAYAGPGTPPGPQPGGTRRRGWLIGLTVGWTVLLLLVGYLSVRQDGPTVREQRDIGQAVPRVDRAVGQLVAAVGPGVTLEIAPRRLVRGCRITPVRDGAVLSQRLTVRTLPSDGPALLDRIAAALPAGYAAETWHSRGGTVHELSADAGEFVAVTGRLVEPGLIELSAGTGCRPIDPDTDPLAGPQPGDPGGNPPERVLDALGVSGAQPAERAGVTCPAGGTAYTARATGRGEPPADPGARLAALAGPGAVVIVDSRQLYAYRSGTLSVVVEAADGEVRVSTTTGC